MGVRTGRAPPSPPPRQLPPFPPPTHPPQPPSLPLQPAAQRSVALHMAAAWEIARELSLTGAEDEAALFGGGVADSVA